MLTGIAPIVFTPFDRDGKIDAEGLRRIVRFELDGGIDAIGVNGFASEAYKLTDDERRQTVEIVAQEVANEVPLIIGIAPESTETAIEQAREFERYHPVTLMTLPPSTAPLTPQDLIDHYVALAQAVDTPITVQQSPQFPRYLHTKLSAQALAEIADRVNQPWCFKIEGKGSAERIAELSPLVDHERVTMLGGGGGITLLDELRAGASGLIPGVGFNDYFVQAWKLWEEEQADYAEALIRKIQPLISATSGPGHEYSLHARKFIMHRAGMIQSATVRRPTVSVSDADLQAIAELVDQLDLRVSQP